MPSTVSAVVPLVIAPLDRVATAVGPQVEFPVAKQPNRCSPAAILVLSVQRVTFNTVSAFCISPYLPVVFRRNQPALGRDGAADGRTAPAGLRHPPLRTGRATFTASGSPSDGLDGCVGNIGFSAILVGFIHPASGVVRFVPLPSDCPPSPCGRLSRPRTTTRALPHVRRWPKAGLLRSRRAGRASQVRPGCIFMPS